MFTVNPGPVKTGGADHFNGEAGTQLGAHAKHEFPAQDPVTYKLHLTLLGKADKNFAQIIGYNKIFYNEN